jgi:hypothetical protein
VHRYPDRVLLKVAHSCPVYCRFCFRREMVGRKGEVLQGGAKRRDRLHSRSLRGVGNHFDGRRSLDAVAAPTQKCAVEIGASTVWGRCESTRVCPSLRRSGSTMQQCPPCSSRCRCIWRCM